MSVITDKRIYRHENEFLSVNMEASERTFVHACVRVYMCVLG